MNSFTCSVSVQLFQIWYVLECYTRFDAWNEAGQMRCLSKAIRIMQPPPAQPVAISYDQCVEPVNWNPVVMGQVVLNQYQQNVLDESTKAYQVQF